MIKSVVFDFNGTLLADTNACWEADNHVIKIFGGTPIALKTYKNTVTIPAIDFYVMHGCNKDELTKNSEKLGKIFHEFYEKRATKLRSRKNAKKVLKWLHENNIVSVILSNHTEVGINYQLERLGMKKYIGKLLANAALDSYLNNGKIEKLKDFLKPNNPEKSGIIIVGDTCEEIEIGKKMGIKAVAITGGYYSAARLRRSNPDYIINNLSNLIGIVKQMNNY